MVGGLGSRASGSGTSFRLLCWGNHLIIIYIYICIMVT